MHDLVRAGLRPARTEARQGTRNGLMKQMFTPWRNEYILGNKAEGCIFCNMLDAGDDVALHVLHRGEHGFLVLNKYPYTNGHMMAVPYLHVPSLEELPPEMLAGVMELASVGLRALRASSRPDGFNVGFNIGKVAGAGVQDHVHCHVVPRWNGDANFMAVLAEVRMIPEDLDETYARLRPVVDQLAP